jgi:TPR repeat protein
VLGQGGARDFAAARQAFGRGCRAGQAQACHELSQLWAKGLGGPRDPARAARWRARACQQGWSAACAPRRRRPHRRLR